MENIGIQDSFFEIGGHSLLATQAVSNLKEAFESTYHCMIYLCFIRWSNWQNRLINCSITKIEMQNGSKENVSLQDYIQKKQK
ncbi:phosphopantetheine-binding protein [Bacillus cereus]